MVAHLTLGKKKYRKVWAEMQQLDRAVGDLVSRLLELTEQDAEAYDGVLSAFRLVQANEAPKEARRESIEAALKRAAIIPMETLRTIVKLTDFVEEAIEKGNPNCLCDAAVAVQLIRAAAIGSTYNVRVNLSRRSGQNSHPHAKRDDLPEKQHHEGGWQAGSADRTASFLVFK